MVVSNEALRAIIVDPCNRGATARNFGNIIELFNDIVEELNSVGAPGGSTLILFRITERIDDRRANASTIVYNDTTLAYELGTSIVVNDWSQSNAFACNIQIGHEGIAILNTNRNGEFDIVVLEGKSRFVEATLTGNFDGISNRANATVVGYWGGFPNKFEPVPLITGTRTIEIHDRLVIRHPLLQSGDSVLALFDDTSGICEYILLQHRDRSQNQVIECLVTVRESGATKCDSIEPNAKFVYGGNTKTLKPAVTVLDVDYLQDQTSIWVVDVRQCDTGKRLNHEECYIACKLADEFNGAESGTDLRPLYGVRGVASEQPKLKRWGLAVTNWYQGRGTQVERKHDGEIVTPTCPYVVVKEIRGCEDETLIGLDSNDTECVKVIGGRFAGEEGYLVYLLTKGDKTDIKEREHPNIESEDIITFELDQQKKYVNDVSGDGKVWDVVMHSRFTGKLRPGWNVMDHHQNEVTIINLVSEGGSGLNMMDDCGLFPRFGYPQQTAIGVSNRIDKDGGRQFITEDELNHLHEVGDSAALHTYVRSDIIGILESMQCTDSVVCNFLYPDDVDGDGNADQVWTPGQYLFGLSQPKVCSGGPSARFSTRTIDPTSQLCDPIDTFSLVEYDQGGTPVPVPNDPELINDECTGTWGPIPIINPFRFLVFYERVDNSEDFVTNANNHIYK